MTLNQALVVMTRHRMGDKRRALYCAPTEYTGDKVPSRLPLQWRICGAVPEGVLLQGSKRDEMPRVPFVVVTMSRGAHWLLLRAKKWVPVY